MPGADAGTPGPTASTTPAPSCPSTAGQGVVAVPSIAFRSLWQTPLRVEPHEHFARPGRGEIEFGDGEARADALEDGGADQHPLSAPSPPGGGAAGYRGALLGGSRCSSRRSSTS